MSFHVAMGKDADLAALARAAAAGQAPAYVVSVLADALGATVHSPAAAGPVRRGDRWRAKLIGTPQHWALARHLEHTLSTGDIVWCSGEDIGIPLAVTVRRRGIKTAVSVHNLDRPRGKLALRFFGAAQCVHAWIVNATASRTFLRSMGVPEQRIHLVLDRTDLDFFAPDISAAEKRRPVIVSVGLEQRDYGTLAAAAADLPVDVKISGFSRDAAELAKAFPRTLPANMTRKYYEWVELAALYRSADVVVCPLFDNGYAAGVTTVLEAAASARPLVATATRGLRDYLSDERAVLTPPGDTAALRAAIVGLLQEPARGACLAQRARQWVEQSHSNQQWVDGIAAVMRRLSGAA